MPTMAVKVVAGDDLMGRDQQTGRRAPLIFEVKRLEDGVSVAATTNGGRGARAINPSTGNAAFSGNPTKLETDAASNSAAAYSVAPIATAEPATTNRVLALVFSKLPAIATPEQPIPLDPQKPPPSPQLPASTGPAPPTNLRIISEVPAPGPPAGSLSLLGVGR